MIDSQPDLASFPARRRMRSHQRKTDPYWVFKEVAKFERWWSDNLEMPLLRAMAEKIDAEWRDAMDSANKRVSPPGENP